MRKVISKITTVLALILLAGVAAFLILMAIGIRPYIVMSGSMEPEIPTGSLCWIDSNYPYEEVQKSDVIAFSTAGQDMVTHRVEQISEQGFVTKGDANDLTDQGVVNRQNYCGKNIGAIPYLGYAAEFIGSLKGKAAVVILLTVFIVLSVVWKKEKQPQSKESK